MSHREIPGYRFDPDTQRYFKVDSARKIPVKQVRNVKDLADALWSWNNETFHLQRSSKSTIHPFFSTTQRLVPMLQVLPYGLPVIWNGDQLLGFQSSRILSRFDPRTRTYTTLPIQAGAASMAFLQSNFVVRKTVCKGGILLASFEDCMEGLWETCFLKFLPDGTVVEAHFQRDELGGHFQAADMLLNGTFLLGIGSTLMLGSFKAEFSLRQAVHVFKESERINSIKISDDGHFAYVACAGGAVYMVSLPSLRIVSKSNIQGASAVREILRLEGKSLTVITFHEDLFEIDFSCSPPVRSAHQLSLAPFKEPGLGEYELVIDDQGLIWSAQLGSEYVCAWKWSTPGRPWQVYHLLRLTIKQLTTTPSRQVSVVV